MNPERKISIAFIKKFREHLDEVFGKKNISTENADMQVQKAIYFAFGEKYDNIKSPEFEEFINQLKTAFEIINTDLLNSIQSIYEEYLPEVITTTMEMIEKELKKNYNENELKELAEIIERPVIFKLFQSNDVFDILKSQKNKLFNCIETGFHTFSDNSKNQEKIHDAIMNVIEQFKRKSSAGKDFIQSFGEDDYMIDNDLDDDNEEFEF